VSDGFQTGEAIIEANLPICDAHHHLWDAPGNRYLLPEFLADIDSGHNIVSTVFVECIEAYDRDAPDAFMPIGETRFVDEIGREAMAIRPIQGICAGIVGFADLNLAAAVGAVLDAHIATSPRFRAIRHSAAWHANDMVRNAPVQPSEHMLSSARFRAGFSELSRRGLTFDTWVYHPQLGEVASLARAFPETTIILDHLGGPLGIGPYTGRREEVFSDWRAGMRRLAEEPNVLVKLGGIFMPLNGWDLHKRESPASSEEVAALSRDYFLTAIDYFGVERCIFESNYPADRPSLPYATIWNVFKRVVADFTVSDKAFLFHDNAVRAYRLAT
jgi:L-fuconolactonase